MLFGKRKKPPAPADYDKTGKVPVLRSSVCTGEQVAGFREADTGRFHEIMLIRDAGDLREFLERYQVEESELRREW